MPNTPVLLHDHNEVACAICMRARNAAAVPERGRLPGRHWALHQDHRRGRQHPSLVAAAPLIRPARWGMWSALSARMDADAAPAPLQRTNSYRASIMNGRGACDFEPVTARRESTTDDVEDAMPAAPTPYGNPGDFALPVHGRASIIHHALVHMTCECPVSAAALVLQ